MPWLKIWSTIKKKIAVMNTIMNTIIEVIQVSRQLVQVILRASARTSSANRGRPVIMRMGLKLGRGASGNAARAAGAATGGFATATVLVDVGAGRLLLGGGPLGFLAMGED